MSSISFHLNLKERLVGRRATIVGWGTTYYGGKESALQRQAQLPIWRNEDCNKAYFQPITENFLCAGYSEGVSYKLEVSIANLMKLFCLFQIDFIFTMTNIICIA